MSEESLFREVDDEIRLERLKLLWSRFGPYIVAVCVVVILAVAGYKGWQYWCHRQALDAGRDYLAALDFAQKGKIVEVSSDFAELATSNHEGYAALAGLQYAALQAALGHTAKAVAIYDAVADKQGQERSVLADLARIRAGLLLVDTASVDELKQRMHPLEAEGSPWRSQAREIVALAAYRAGNFTTAGDLFNTILMSPDAAFGLRRRARLMLDLIAPMLDAKARS
ncbi:MAG: tetratricopeptide repeat protein [Hyphomicrobiales bacterium]